MKYDRNMCEREKVIHLSVFFVRRFAFELQKNSLHRNRNCCYSISGFDCWMCFRFISFSSVCLSPPCSKNNCDARDKQLPFFFFHLLSFEAIVDSIIERTNERKLRSTRSESNPKTFQFFPFQLHRFDDTIDNGRTKRRRHTVQMSVNVQLDENDLIKCRMCVARVQS